MQMFGIGVLELMVIFIIAVLVVGPERVPQFAADLARWIRRTRAYANHLMRDFNEVMGDFEKEVGASREDWKEIASVVTRHTGDVAGEITKVANQVEKSAAFQLDEAKTSPTNVVPFEAARPLGEATPEEAEALASAGNGTDAGANTPASGDGQSSEDEAAEGAEDKPWYETQRTATRRRRSSSRTPDNG